MTLAVQFQAKLRIGKKQNKKGSIWWNTFWVHLRTWVDGWRGQKNLPINMDTLRRCLVGDVGCRIYIPKYKD